MDREPPRHPIGPQEEPVLDRALRRRDARAARPRDIWAMTREQRIEAFWAGDLTVRECLQWSARAQDEVPKAPDGEFLYIACRTPEWLGD